ncbi:MAG: cysteine--tRNA ligase, partial [Candidatus Saccharimonas sp.]
MAIKFANTLTRHLDTFVPLQPGKVSLYTCGPTVYSYLHVGNWAAYIYWDILVRMLQAEGYEVERVMNITDVGHLTSDADEGEDKLEKGARREGKTAWQIAKFYADDFICGMNALHLTSPSQLARATDYIDEQIQLAITLKRKGHTYQTSDGIYFDTSTFPAYADFARLDLRALRAGARIGPNSEKRHASDFALWKFSPTGVKRDMEWPTPPELLDQPPTGGTPVMGFPGWHLECSAIAMHFLG